MPCIGYSIATFVFDLHNHHAKWNHERALSSAFLAEDSSLLTKRPKERCEFDKPVDRISCYNISDRTHVCFGSYG